MGSVFCVLGRDNMTGLIDNSRLFLMLQVASTSRGPGVPSTQSGTAPARNCKTTHVPRPPPAPNTLVSKAQENRGTRGEAPQVLALREGQALPEGYSYVVRTPGSLNKRKPPTDTVDLSTPPDVDVHVAGEDADATKRRIAEKKNETRSKNKQAHASFAREVKESLAAGRPPSISVSDQETHLKARWHSAAKEVAYKVLDMRKEGWKGYTMHDKGKLHKELNEKYKFDPPLDPQRVEKYLAGHFRSSRAVWKAHWLKHGDDDRHHNCPEDAWEQLIQWWPTEACREESAEMAVRRSRVQNGSKTGRKQLVDRMDEQVRLRWS